MQKLGSMTRRQFLKISGLAAAFCLAGKDLVGEAYAKTQDFFSRRLACVYKRDTEMALRKSQDNPLVKQMYRDFLGHPLSEESEKLLHTVYVSRKAAVEQIKAMGIKLNV